MNKSEQVKNEYLLSIGATSDIGFAIAKEFYSRSFNLILAARDIESLKKRFTGFDPERLCMISFNSNDLHSITNLIDALPQYPSVVVDCIGYLGNQQIAQTNEKETLEIISTNFTMRVILLNAVAEILKNKQHGCIICVSSMAGERGRKSNFVYGSAKAGLTTYLSGLRQYLYPFGVHVITVIPGFVKTKMTNHLQLPKKLTTSPEKLAIRVFHAFKNKRNIIYSSFTWQLISLIIKHIPEPLYKRLKNL